MSSFPMAESIDVGDQMPLQSLDRGRLLIRPMIAEGEWGIQKGSKSASLTC